MTKNVTYCNKTHNFSFPLFACSSFPSPISALLQPDLFSNLILIRPDPICTHTHNTFPSDINIYPRDISMLVFCRFIYIYIFYHYLTVGATQHQVTKYMFIYSRTINVIFLYFSEAGVRATHLDFYYYFIHKTIIYLFIYLFCSPPNNVRRSAASLFALDGPTPPICRPPFLPHCGQIWEGSKCPIRAHHRARLGLVVVPDSGLKNRKCGGATCEFAGASIHPSKIVDLQLPRIRGNVKTPAKLSNEETGERRCYCEFTVASKPLINFQQLQLQLPSYPRFFSIFLFYTRV